MKRFRDLISEAIDPDDGHEPYEVTWKAVHSHGKRGLGTFDASKLVAFHHQSICLHDANNLGHDHGYILRRADEAPEDFWRRAQDITRRPFAGMGEAEKPNYWRTLENHLRFYNLGHQMGQELCRPRPDGTGYDNSTHHLHPICRS